MTLADQRQRRLARYYLDGGVHAARLSATARLTARTLGFPHGQINILDDQTQYTVGGYGMADLPSVVSREVTLCQHVVDGQETIVADDLRDDPRFADLDFVREGVMLSYVGVPVRSRESSTLGTICVMDSQPHHITRFQVEQLTEFAHIVEDQLDLMRAATERHRNGTSAGQLARAIEEDEILPWFQPVVDLRTGRTVGWEALARWEHPGGEIEDPSRFVPLAEDSDLVLDLDLAVIRGALREIRPRLDRDPRAFVTVNLSTRHLETPGGVAEVHRVAVEADIDPTRITVELTESRAILDQDAATAAVADLRSRGFWVLLDDFGTGWSSLDWIMQLDVSGFKVDRSITGALGSRMGDAMARAVVSFAQELGLYVVLEGVSSQTDVDLARQLGFSYGQGYFWSPPVPAGELAPSEEDTDTDVPVARVAPGYEPPGPSAA